MAQRHTGQGLPSLVLAQNFPASRVEQTHVSQDIKRRRPCQPYARECEFEDPRCGRDRAGLERPCVVVPDRGEESVVGVPRRPFTRDSRQRCQREFDLARVVALRSWIRCPVSHRGRLIPRIRVRPLEPRNGATRPEQPGNCAGCVDSSAPRLLDRDQHCGLAANLIQRADG